jgi:hypothetical protein
MNVMPAYRIYTVDGGAKDGRNTNASWVVTDHDTHVLNMTASNLERKLVWHHEYAAKVRLLYCL